MAAPPPWHLAGDGYIWLFKFPRDFVEHYGFLAEWQRSALRLTLGAVMLIDYRQSNVGPYRELLFIPGQLKLAGQRVFSISKAYVSTSDSVVNGIENWGIPKQLATFERMTSPDGGERFGVALDGRAFFTARLEPFGPRFPVSSELIPLTVGQERRGDLLITRSTASGTGRPCRTRELQVAAPCFPDVSKLKPITALAVQDLCMTFPLPQIVPGFFGSVRSP